MEKSITEHISGPEFISASRITESCATEKADAHQNGGEIAFISCDLIPGFHFLGDRIYAVSD